jgi:hypothetical protein
MNLENSIKIVAMEKNDLYNKMPYLKEKISPKKEKCLNRLISQPTIDKKQTFQHLKLKSFENSIIANNYFECDVIDGYPNRNIKLKKNQLNSENVFL